MEARDVICIIPLLADQPHLFDVIGSSFPHFRLRLLDENKEQILGSGFLFEVTLLGHMNGGLDAYVAVRPQQTLVTP